MLSLIPPSNSSALRRAGPQRSALSRNSRAGDAQDLVFLRIAEGFSTSRQTKSTATSCSSRISADWSRPRRRVSLGNGRGIPETSLLLIQVIQDDSLSLLRLAKLE